MKKIIVFFAVALLSVHFTAYAQQTVTTGIPRTISYQGYVADAANKPLVGNHTITVKLYDALVEGALLHTEAFASTIDHGTFSVIIGSQQPLESSLLFDKQYWLGVSVDEGGELSPRTALASVPYAIHADVASSLSRGASGAVTTLNGRSGDILVKGGAGTTIQSNGNTITISATPVISNGDIHTQATTVNSITGTANQVLANGTSGSKQSGDVTLTTPQNINTGASPTFNGMTLSSFGTSGLVHNNGSGSLSSSLLTNADVANNAAIAYTKLNLTGSISNSDVANGANIAASKLNLANGITSGDIVAGTIVNSDINAGAGIAYSKLNLVGSISNNDVSGGANIAYSKLNLAGNIDNADIAAGANISASKINLNNAITSGDIAAGTIMNSDINAAANIAYSKLNLNGSIDNGDIAGGAAIADTKLATISAAGKVANSATTATSSNTANAIVHRDGSGNFSAGTITATLNGTATNVTGTIDETNGGTGTTTYTKGDILYASAANSLSKRAIGATGQVLTISGGVPVWSALSGVGVTSATGTANQVLVNGGSGTQITGGITLTLPQNIHTGASPTFTGMTLSGMSTAGVVHNNASGVLSNSLIVNADVDPAAAIADSKLATISTVGKIANTATTATALNTNNAIVARDASGGFSAGTIAAANANLSGKATSASTVDADPPGTLTTKDYVDNIAIEYWSVGGNSGLSAGTNYFGTNDATDLCFRTNASEGMRITNGGSLLLSGSSGSVPTSGAGTRMMWIPSLGSIRAGKANGSEWDASNVGAQSVAMGYGTLASGGQSVAMGFFTAAYGMGSTAIGSGVSAYVDGSTAFGSAAQAVGFNSVAMGDNTTAWGDGSVAMGSNTNSNGLYSTAMGYQTSTIANNGMSTGKNLKVGQSSFGFNGSTTTNIVDVSSMNNTAYFGDVNMIIGNDDNSARSLMFYGSNNTSDLSGAFYTAFTAQTQSANITYTLPASQGSANSLMTNNGTGVMSWSSLSSLNLPSGSGTANTIALWSSTSALGAASNLYYSSNKLGIGVSSPSQALDVSGNANISGTITSGSSITTNGLAMSGGTAVLSYGTVSAGATITIPNNAVVKINDDAANLANAVTMPSGTNGQIIHIFNNDAQATTGDVTIAASAMGVFIYVDGWRKAN